MPAVARAWLAAVGSGLGAASLGTELLLLSTVGAVGGMWPSGMPRAQGEAVSSHPPHPTLAPPSSPVHTAAPYHQASPLTQPRPSLPEQIEGCDLGVLKAR